VMHNRGSRGEVAEPGLRRTPGTRVDSKGSRGFESPPLRHPVRDIVALCMKLENTAHVYIGERGNQAIDGPLLLNSDAFVSVFQF
jgi:hypothetical protein